MAAKLKRVADEIDARTPPGHDELDFVVAEIRRVQNEISGPPARSPRGKGAKSKILAYLLARTGEDVPGSELAAISGIQEWPRRVRELRVEDGYPIVEVSSGVYRLEDTAPDLDKASAWKTANAIRKREGAAIDRVKALFEARVGAVVTRDQIDYVAKTAEGIRRVRELRDEHGWPINSHIDEPDLEPGQYRLTSSDPRDRRDPLQRLYSEHVRQSVFERDDYTCQECGRNREKAAASGDTRFYLEVHHRVAVADELADMPKSERNNVDNLVTLCHRDHLKATSELQSKRRRERRG